MTDVEAGIPNEDIMAVGTVFCGGPKNGGVRIVEKSIIGNRNVGRASINFDTEGRLIFNGCGALKAGRCTVIKAQIAPDCPIAARSNGIESLADKRVLTVQTPRFALTLDRDVRELRSTNRAEPIDLTPKEFMLVGVLMRNYGIVLSRGQIMDALYPDDSDLRDSSIVPTYISSIRKKIDGPGRSVNASFVQTKRGFGYTIPRIKNPK